MIKFCGHEVVTRKTKPGFRRDFGADSSIFHEKLSLRSTAL